MFKKCFNIVDTIIHKPKPYLNSYLNNDNKYIYYDGKISSETKYCIVSFCAGKKTDSFIKLTHLAEKNRLSLCSVFLIDGGDCYNSNCPGHTCDETCDLHSWNINNKTTNIFKDKHSRNLLNDRKDLNWNGKNTILNYKDWGTAHNKCPYCGCKYQKWYKKWKENIKEWKKLNILGLFIIIDKDLGLGQQKELCYLKKKKYKFKIIKHEDLIEYSKKLLKNK